MLGTMENKTIVWQQFIKRPPSFTSASTSAAQQPIMNDARYRSIYAFNQPFALLIQTCYRDSTDAPMRQ
jgi:hypothetical protein